MPEAAVDKHYLAAPRKDEVRSAGQVGAVKPVAVSEAMRGTANKKLGLGIALANARHPPANRVGDIGKSTVG